MKRFCAPLVFTGIMLSVLGMSGVSRAQTSPIALSCVFQGAGGLEKTITIDLKNNKVTNGYSDYKVYPIKEVTDSVVRWHEASPDVSSENELDRTSGNLTRRIVQQGQAFVWTYACRRVQKQF